MITEFREDLFEIENARNLSTEQIVNTFVPIKTFWRMLSSKHHILLGSRGSGKTVVLKMIAHDHLSLLDGNERARSIVLQKKYIGLYFATSIEWVSALKNKTWLSEDEQEILFQWRFNLSACIAFLKALESCLKFYYQDRHLRARVESELCQDLSESWFNEPCKVGTVESLRSKLEDIDYKKQQEYAKNRALQLKTRKSNIGHTFYMDILAPLKRGILLAHRKMELPDSTTWIICIDEAEYLSEAMQKILNSLMRTNTGNIFIKMATMPYKHKTKETNLGVDIVPGNDYEYINLDSDPVFIENTINYEFDENNAIRKNNIFAEQIFAKRLHLSQKKYENISVQTLLGNSVLLDPKTTPWEEDDLLQALFYKFASDETKKRAKTLLYKDRSSFYSQVVRKMHGALLLRESVEQNKGNAELSVFSGVEMAYRCSDLNPRRLIRIFNAMLNTVTRNDFKKNKFPMISAKEQTAIFIRLSQEHLKSVEAEEGYGQDLYHFMKKICEYMEESFYKRPLSTDQIFSVSVDRNVDHETWKMVKEAVGLGLLYPNTNTNAPDQLPSKEGKFHVAYFLAPAYNLLPRRGKSVSINSILTNKKSKYRKLKNGNVIGQENLWYKNRIE